MSQHTLRYHLTPVDSPEDSAHVPAGMDAHPKAGWRIWTVSLIRSTPAGKPTSSDDVHGAIGLARVGDTWHGPYLGSPKGPGLTQVCRNAIEQCLDEDADEDGAWTTTVTRSVALDGNKEAALRRSLRRLGMQREAMDDVSETWRYSPTTEHATFDSDQLVVALSGGGLRATAYSLGVFWLLDSVGARDGVRCITSVSGGSIFSGALVAWHARSARTPSSFPAFIDDTRRFLRTEPRRAGLPDVGGKPTLIARYADLAERELLHGPVEGTALRLGELATEGVPEVIFQITEMTLAGSFLLGVTANKRVKFGVSGRLELDDGTVVDHVRLADAVTASAAFPGGFEPFVFPRDFDLPPSVPIAVEEKMRERRRAQSWPAGTGFDIPLVDGGVFDNQGIAALRSALSRHDDDVDLALIVDVDRTDTAMALLSPSPTETAGWVLALLAVLAVLVVLPAILAPMVSVPILLLGLGLIVTAVLLFVIGRRVVVAVGGKSLPPALKLDDLLSIKRIGPAVWSRLTLALSLLTDAFMRRVRRMSYNDLFDQGVARHVQVAAVGIRDLVEAGDTRPDGGVLTVPESMALHYPRSVAIVNAAEVTTEMETVLHLGANPADRQRRADAAICAGRATTAWAWMRVLHEAPRPRPRSTRERLARLEALWKEEFSKKDQALPNFPDVT